MNTQELAVHPYAARFPRLSDSELMELATSIQESGQIEPIVIDIIDEVETILDGRNRLAACEIAGVEPQIETLEALCGRQTCGFVGAVSFIAAKNIYRRHLSDSVAAALALEAVDEVAAVDGDEPGPGPIYEPGNEFDGIDDPSPEEHDTEPKPGPGRPPTPRSKAQDTVSKDTGVSKRDLQRAEALRDVRPDLFEKVEQGKMKLRAAEEKMTADAKAAVVAEEKTTAVKERLADQTPEFRDAVARGQMLKDVKSIVKFSELQNDEKTHIRNLMATGWAFSRACRFMFLEVTTATTVKQLIGLAEYSGGRLETIVDDWAVTIEKEKPVDLARGRQ